MLIRGETVRKLCMQRLAGTTTEPADNQPSFHSAFQLRHPSSRIPVRQIRITERTWRHRTITLKFFSLSISSYSVIINIFLEVQSTRHCGKVLWIFSCRLMIIYRSIQRHARKSVIGQAKRSAAAR